MFQQTTDDVNNILSYIRKQADYPYLEQHFQVPQSTLTEVLVTYEIIQQQPAVEKRSQIMCATLLIKQALDIHEDVSEGTLATEAMRKERQLAVLAGDYYSGLYYRELAKLANEDLLAIFSQAIGDINQVRANYYEQLPQTKGDLGQLMVTESLIHTSLAGYFGFTQQQQTIYQLALALARLKQRPTRLIDTQIEQPQTLIETLVDHMATALKQAEEGTVSVQLKTHLNNLIDPNSKGETVKL